MEPAVFVAAPTSWRCRRPTMTFHLRAVQELIAAVREKEGEGLPLGGAA